MGTVCLVVGGRRSGKSEYARALAEKATGPRAFVATCPVLDKEMAERIRKHQEQRKRSQWDTIEEPIKLSSVVSNVSNYNVVLVDCLTLWINNLMYEYSKHHLSISEEIVAEKSNELIRACSNHHGKIILVTNETGLGIVPDNEQARLFLDLVGRCNQIVAEEADQVILVICGQPLIIKKGGI